MPVFGHTLRVARILHLALLVSVPLYVVAGEIVGPSAPRDVMRIRQILFLLALVQTGAAFLLRYRLAGPAAEALRAHPEDEVQISRWMSGNIGALAIAEAIGLLGLVVRVLGATLPEAAPFYVASFVLLLLLTPRNSANQ